MLGEQVGQYRLEVLLGEGGFGAVYRGVHVHMGSIEAAIKVAHADLTRDPTFEKMMRRECEILYGLSHPNIVRFRDLIVEPGVLAVAMELLEGEELAERLERGPLQPDQVLDLVEAMLEGLAYAHAKGVSHRDIKPANVFLCTDGTVKLMDFGIAKATHSTKATRTGMVSGSVDYMAPERFSGHSSPSADVYAVGLVAWELLAGRPACPDGDLPSKIGWHLGKGAPRLKEAIPTCPSWLAALIASWCATEVQDRPATAHDALEQLRQARREHDSGSLPSEPAAHTQPRPQPAPLPPKRRLPWLPVLAGLSVMGIALLLLVVVALLVGRTMLAPQEHEQAFEQLYQRVEAFDSIAQNDQRLLGQKVAALEAIEGAGEPLGESEDLDLAVEALLTLAHCRRNLGTWLAETDCTGSGETATCGPIEGHQQDQARHYLESARDSFIDVEQRMEEAGVHDERHADAQALTREIDEQLRHLERHWSGEPFGPVEQVDAAHGAWLEYQARLEGCDYAPAQRLLDDLAPLNERVGQVLEAQDGSGAEELLTRAEALMPRVERMLGRCP